MTVTDDRGKYFCKKILKSCKVLLRMQNYPETIVVECFITSVCVQPMRHLPLLGEARCEEKCGCRLPNNYAQPGGSWAGAQPGIMMGSPVLHLIALMNCGWIRK